jgi:hypothetical protein
MGRFSARTRRKIWPRFKTGINAKAVVQIRVARLFLVQHTKNGKYIPNDHRIERMASKYTEWPQNIPNGHKMYQHFPLQDPPKYTKIGIFGLKIYYLANLVQINVQISPFLSICICRKFESAFTCSKCLFPE